jgi:hypothetical protein
MISVLILILEVRGETLEVRSGIGSGRGLKQDQNGKRRNFSGREAGDVGGFVCGYDGD